MTEYLKVANMAVSKLEINFRRLLERCETMAAELQDNKENVSWRLEKYVSTLQKQITELKNSSNKPSADTMNEYNKKVEFLKGLIETQKLKSPTEKLIASQQLVRPLSQTLGQTTATEKDRPANRAQELHIRAKSQIHKEMRNELLGDLHVDEKREDTQGLRNRLTGDKKRDTKDDSIDTVLQYHQKMQENIAEEMIKMAKNLKHTSVMASNIIKEDNKALEQATKLADSNFEKLKRESEKLEELTQASCSWWIWIMLITVCIVFMFMIMFIRLFPKK
ncbi:vesicle transport protein USE1-like [Montipora capricornis]|uniref:vesicle transport protein USE1-like n=1 Tax=Montipora capricornis TaxID=246305 RepID=UPI0035F104F5